MKHFARICDEFLKFAIEQDWWKRLPREQQLQYLKEHRKTKLRPTVGQFGARVRRILTSLPKAWRKDLVVMRGVGENSPVEQLSDVLRPRELKAQFDDHPSTVAIVGFKSGTPVTAMEPEFIIYRESYREDKFNCKVMSKAGKPVDPNSYDAFICKEKIHYRRSWRGNWTEHQTDLRMSAITERLPDKPYTVFAVDIDPERQKARQQRSAFGEGSKHRDIEKAMIAKVVKPIYDYYAASLQDNISKLKDYAVPAFDEVMYGMKGSNVNDYIDRIKLAREKLSDVQGAVESFSYHHLPGKDEPYIEPSESSAETRKRRIHEFLDEVKDLKTRFREDYERAIRRKMREAAALISSAGSDKGHFFGLGKAADILIDMDQQPLASEILQSCKDNRVEWLEDGVPDVVKQAFIEKMTQAVATAIEATWPQNQLR